MNCVQQVGRKFQQVYRFDELPTHRPIGVRATRLDDDHLHVAHGSTAGQQRAQGIILELRIVLDVYCDPGSVLVVIDPEQFLFSVQRHAIGRTV